MAFDKGVWPSREVPCSQVRQRRKAAPCLVDGAEAMGRDGPVEKLKGTLG